MYPSIKFHAEWFIRKNIEEIRMYSDVLETRIAGAFSNLEAEADSKKQDLLEQYRQAATADETLDDSAFSGLAETEAASFYNTMIAIRQGIINLMTAGLYHLLEQQASIMCKRVLPLPKAAPAKKVDFPMQLMQHILTDQGIDIEGFTCWPKVEKLRLIANVIKHGEGHSAEKVDKDYPGVIDRRPEPDFGFGHDKIVIRPLFGEGLTVSEEEFAEHAGVLIEFWKETRDALEVVMCPTQK